MTELVDPDDFYRGRSVVVTGGAGFIGSHLVRRLVGLGARVGVIDDLSGGSLENLSDVSQSISFCEGSILDSDAVGSLVAGCDVVFHEAALGSVPGSIDEPRRYHDANITGTLTVLEECVRADVRRVVFASSSSVYGDQPVLPKEESQYPDPLSPYAMQKLAGEELMRVWSLCYGISTVCLRYFNIFGPNQRADSAYAAVVAAFAKALLTGERPRIFGDGTASRDFTFCDDVVDANLRAGCVGWSCDKPADHPATCGGVMNIARGECVTVQELAEMTGSILGVDAHPIFEPERAGDVLHSLADISRARTWLGFEPSVTVRTGLEQTLAWYRGLLAGSESAG